MTLQAVENFYGDKGYPYIFKALSIIEDNFEFYIKDKRKLSIKCQSDISDFELYIHHVGTEYAAFCVSYREEKGETPIEKHFRKEYDVYKYIQELFGVEISN